MLTLLVAAERKLLETWATAWLQTGAQGVAIWDTEDQVLCQWGNSAGHPDLQSPILHGRQALGTLAIYGLVGEPWVSLLDADARLLGEFARLNSELEQMTAELVDTQDQLLALYNLTQSMRSHLEIGQVLDTLTAQAVDLFKTEAAFAIFRHQSEPLIAHHPATRLSDEAITALFDELAQQGGQKLLLDRAHGATLAPSVENLLLKPIFVQDHLVAGLGLVNRGGGFSSPDLKLADAMAEQVGVQFENVLRYQEHIAQTRMQTEMDLARQVQERLLPNKLPQIAGLDLFGASQSAFQVGGDFFDFLPRNAGRLLVGVGDVSGKGMPAALLMAMTRTAMRSAARLNTASPAALLAIANEDLYDDFTEVTMFATVFVAVYEPAQRELTYANAGHSPVIYCPKGGQARLLEADGPALGILPDSLSFDQRLTLSTGDILVIATDGFPEANAPDGEMFGYRRLLDLVQANANATALQIAEALWDEVGAFSADSPQSDDQTVIVMKGVDLA